MRRHLISRAPADFAPQRSLGARAFCPNNRLTSQFAALSFLQMDRDDYLQGIASLYAAEVLGEGLASRWLELCSDLEQKYKLSLFLQLESEAKVRLRPLLARYNLSLVEDQSQRAAGAAVAEQFAAVPWRQSMATLAELALPYAQRFQALLQVAPPEDLPLLRFMVDHEQQVVRIAGHEAAGEAIMASQLVVMLAHPFAAFER